ncbi:MAG: single-stranded-DNA-specific exonuclease RecJ [Bacteroidia bacterium]|nr:MAG: single-stranded-DNA-specific exonuclease RecJ [Bacteroidia bacterium]
MSPVREYRWNFGSNGSASEADVDFQANVKRITDELSISPILAEILVHRGITTKEMARVYFRPTVDDLHNPFLMSGMDVAVERVLKAVKNGEPILVYGDYDVDGTNGASLLFMFLRAVGARVTSFIPDRIKDGYGLTPGGIRRAKDQGVRLLIAIDCGITAVDQVAYAASLGIDVIVCDHHEPGPVLPPAVAILNPLKPGCTYPFKHLCGCGVGFKFIQALSTQDQVVHALGEDADYHLARYLDFVALASTADIVALSGENRTLVKLGLELINTEPRPGIRALIETSGLKPGRITAGQIVFILAPRINAVGRLGDANRAVELLTCDSYEKALTLARVFEEENKNRRRIDEETFMQAQDLVEGFLDMEKEGAIVLHRESWHPGVIGIVASRLVERYYRPAIMLTTVDGVAKGSARSVAGFDIYQALKRCESTLLQFGGHKHAAGLTIAVDRIEEFKEAFSAVAKELLTDDVLTPEIRIDAAIELSDLTPKFIRILNQFAPFGPRNMRPVFAVRNGEIVGSPRIVGNNHLRFKVRQNTRVFDAIGFNLGGLIDRLAGRRVDLAFSIDESDFAGELVPQLKLRDIKTTGVE